MEDEHTPRKGQNDPAARPLLGAPAPNAQSFGERWPWPEMQRQHLAHGGRAKKGKSAALRGPQADPGLPPPQNWVPDPGRICGELTADEQDAAAKYALEDLFAGKAPVAAESRPHALFTIGAPGSGKSTVAMALVRVMGAHPAESYVVLDYDALIKYHPRFRDTWRVPDVFGRPTEVGYALGWMRCIDALDDLGQVLHRKIFTERYNVVVQTHAHDGMIAAQLAGYDVTLLYVGVPLGLAVHRARKRAVETGRFLAPTLEIQDRHIEQTWARYKRHAPWYGLWADEVIVAKNDRDGAPPSKHGDFAYINPHEAWPGSITKMMAAIASAHDEGAKG
jgi:predicted ABC-type ATPase